MVSQRSGNLSKDNLFEKKTILLLFTVVLFDIPIVFLEQNNRIVN